jgi:hypothetical protein
VHAAAVRDGLPASRRYVQLPFLMRSLSSSFLNGALSTPASRLREKRASRCHGRVRRPSCDWLGRRAYAAATATNYAQKVNGGQPFGRPIPRANSEAVKARRVAVQGTKPALDSLTQLVADRGRAMWDVGWLRAAAAERPE